jgi:hypothetical protein
MKFHTALARALVEHGTDTLFGVLGDGNEDGLDTDLG